ncbi:hypothetical protein [Paenibacillus glacialis]|uniref:S-adenosylmethionine decarboxylase n=1 Tax=Paenibacillus glacialis TaxID=494026 RepID=A0A168PEE1_9BACL|nr:hypothetical protein [Paenibacillus glacialis]OAB46681.1 hypothetical protein PGLA_00180 [Paenibacillus glacialis]
MKRRKNKDFLFLCVILILVGSLLYQGYRMFKPNEEKVDASQMLFEVADFQMGILNSSLMEAVHMSATGQLAGLKLAAYAANFSHERMVRAFGVNELESLPAISELVNLITSWQIGGERPLSQKERDFLVDFSTKFAEVLPIYSLLVNSSNHIDSTQSDQLNQLGNQLDELTLK